jgi:uncharacterized protein
MKIGIVGTGISGLSCAHLLQHDHDITLFESNNYAGGHTNTIQVNDNGKNINVDTGFIVYNNENYPNLCKLFDLLDVQGRNSDMSFSVVNEKTGLEYNGSGFNKLFCQRQNLLNPRFWKMLRDIFKFNDKAPGLLLNGLDDKMTVNDFVKKNAYSNQFINEYLIPLGASLWSAPAGEFLQYPIRFVIEFLNNHRMLQVANRPAWKTVKGGSNTYVKKILDSFHGQLRLNTPVKHVTRSKNKIDITLASGQSETFDEVILASHADQCLQMVQNPGGIERGLLGMFPYQYNEAILHYDTEILPSNNNAWASWNYRIPSQEADHVTVTYNMNMLQGLDASRTYCVSLNQSSGIANSKIIKRIQYYHPVFQPGRADAQASHHRLIRHKGISYCGAYWGYGFHEDGIKSALAVCSAYGKELN